MPETGATNEVILGEVHTALLRSSCPISQDAAQRILGLVIGAAVRRSERPIPYAVSPERLTGIDCHLPTGSGALVRAVGTVISRVSLTGGHAVQGSAFLRVRKGMDGRRLPWSHYLAHPGVAETVGKVTPAGLIEGFESNLFHADVLDLGSIADRALEEVQSHRDLDQNPPFKTRRTHLRWLSSSEDSQDYPIKLQFGPDLLRTALLPRQGFDSVELAAFCEDLALHDWLLTTLLAMIGRARIGSGDRKKIITRLEPALDFLLHLWMPAARIRTELFDLWRAIDRRPGLTRQWDSAVNRLRDQLVLALVASHKSQVTDPKE